MSSNINLGFVITTDDSQWTGGLEYFSNLFQAIQRADKDHVVKITGLLVPGVQETRIPSLLKYLVQTLPLPPLPTTATVSSEPKTFYQKLRRRKHIGKLLRSLFPDRPVQLPGQFDALGFDLIFMPVGVAGLVQRMDMVWIPDFQHEFIPDMFQPSEITERRRLFELAAEQARMVILSSQTACDHFAIFHPSHKHKARVLRFAPNLPQTVTEAGGVGFHKKYHIPEKFFYLPNQFWIHKNHQLVVDAIELCVEQNPDICVVCTGGLYDYRSPMYSTKLISEISKRGLRNHVIVLGLIDRQDVYSLMRYSIAVVQPSLFEGWSTTTEEAKAMGKTIILSDIPTHREQDPKYGIYFDPADARQLSQILLKQWNEPGLSPDLERESLARAENERQLFDFGNRFISYMNELINENQKQQASE
jgi:glycosyltransferase involved in cell wall biosynthesis